ncbi:MAG: hypothetical protein MJK12_16695 [Colwellia sp.]|nr:hypothetical protein [Colwellia sp.]
MVTEIVGKAAVSSVTTHIIKWVANLGRAGDLRKNESRACLEKVILAVIKTKAYCSSLDDGEQIDHAKESEIAVEWRSLSMELERLKLLKLAKKCKVKSWYWEDQGRFDAEFLQKAQVGFEQVERTASLLLRDINA